MWLPGVSGGDCRSLAELVPTALPWAALLKSLPLLGLALFLLLTLVGSCCSSTIRRGGDSKAKQRFFRLQNTAQGERLGWAQPDQLSFSSCGVCSAESPLELGDWAALIFSHFWSCHRGSCSSAWAQDKGGSLQAEKVSLCCKEVLLLQVFDGCSFC